jgi:outer membrane protein TolC
MTERRRAGGRTRRTRSTLPGLVLAVLAGTGAAMAQESPAALPRIEFDAAIQRALERNPTVAEAAAAVRRAEALLEGARAVNLPSLVVSGSRTRRDQEIAFDGTVAQPQTQTAVAATASVPVLAAADWAAAAQSRDQLRVSQLAAVETRQQVAVATAQTYLAIIAARRQAEVEQDALDNAREHLGYARKRLEGGAGSRLDEVRAAQQVSAQELRLEGSRLALFDSQAALGALLAEDGPVDAGAEPAFEVPESDDPASWRNDRPDLRLRTAAMQAAERVKKDDWKDWVPTADLAYTKQWLTPSGVFQRSSSWQLSLLFSEPLFEGGRHRSDARLRAADLDRAKLQLTAAEIQARSEIQVARESLESYRRALISARDAAAQADEVLHITTSAFELGSTTNLEVIDAERSARDAATAAALAEDDVRRGSLNLLVALGRFPREPEGTDAESGSAP